jgi:hypothetical protein
MIHLTTLSDINYLSQGLALIESLKKSSQEITVHYCCLDDETYDILLDPTTNVYVIPYKHEWVGLKQLKERNYSDYCYTLASYFTQWVAMEENPDSICYIDSDIYFHKDIDFLYKSLGNADVGIFSHLQFTKQMNRSEGLYNCGVVYFSRNGFPILDWWANAVLTKEPKELATCFDQRFLEAFPMMTENIAIDCVKHGAMWQWQVMSEKDIGDVCFTHFSKLKWDEDGFTPSTQHQQYTANEQVMANPKLRAIYENYWSVVKSFKI